MNDDDLLRRLAETAREEEQGEDLDPRWEALARGELSAEEKAALTAEAETTMEARRAHEAFSPLGPEFRSRVVAAIRSQQGEAAAPPTVASLDEARERRRARLGPRRHHLGWAASAALVAAALALVLWPTGSPPPLPGYRASLSGAVETLRSGEPSFPTGRLLFVPGNRFELVLSPDEAVEEPVAMAAFLQQGGKISPWSPPVETSEAGSIRIVGRVGEEIELPAGEIDVLVAVGHPRRLPSGAAHAGRLGDGDRLATDDWVGFRLPLEVREGP